MKAMETLQDLIEEAKVRTVWWALCIFAFAYFISHTSKSMWMNIPIAILVVSGLRILANEVEFRWKVRPEGRPRTYLSYLEKKQLSLNDPRLSTAPPAPKWKRKVDSPLVENAINEFVSKILQDFVIDLWYTEITPDKEAPELIGSVITDAIGEISGRVKQLNLVDLLTRDVVDLIGDHLDLFRRNQAAIGVEVMGTLSIEERDERLKHHLMASKELHPALISPECEYKVLQRLIGGVLAVVLKPREAQSPLVRCIARELVTCLVMQPVMNFASPAYINELIEYILLAAKDGDQSNAGDHHVDRSVTPAGVQDGESKSRKHASPYKSGTDMTLTKFDNHREISLGSGTLHEDPMQVRPADWVRVMEAATQRRTEILAPENLENMWTKGRNYKKKVHKNAKAGFQEPIAKGLKSNCPVPASNLTREMLSNRPGSSAGKEDKALLRLKSGLSPYTQTQNQNNSEEFSQDLDKGLLIEGGPLVGESEDSSAHAPSVNKNKLKRSNSTSALKAEPNTKKAFNSEVGVTILSEDFYSASISRYNDEYNVKSASDIVYSSEGLHVTKLRCRVIGAYFEKVGSKSFAVYSIAVTDAENTTWFVKRRYRNFERLHRQLKDIPNYTLHLPPKRIFSSSMEDAFVHQRCIQLDKYLQDLLSIANVAEQHEVWDFLSVSSKNYSFGKSPSVMKTLVVNVDDAMDDIVRQFKGVSDGLMRKVVGSSSLPYETSTSISGRNLSWHAEDMSKHISRHSTAESTNSFSDNDEGEKDGCHGHEEVESSAPANGWHSDNELNSKSFPPRVIKRSEDCTSLISEKKHGSEVNLDWMGLDGNPAASFPATSDGMEDPLGMPPEWTPPNVSVPILNLVDKIFQLKRRGWLRRQVFWISKQILQLMMEDAIDDWLLRQIHWLRRDDIIAEGIQWIQDVLWPDGTFFLRLRNTQSEINDSEPDQKPDNRTASLAGSKVSKAGSFEQQLEAARRASDIKKMLFGGAPTTLVSLIGHKQYKRCAKDIYYFSQSTICVKQLAYGVLELVLISVFPELRDLVVDVHKQMRGKAV